MSSILESYIELGLRPIPIIPGTKRPAVNWRSLQTGVLSRAVIKRLFIQSNDEDFLGFITGERSGIVVLDIDIKNGGKGSLATLGSFPITPKVRTGSGGLHYYFKWPGYPVKNFAGKLPGVDLRGDGGFVVAPPTLHPDTQKPYSWIVPPWSIPFATLPWQIVRLVDRKSSFTSTKSDMGSTKTGDSDGSFLAGVGEGRRNQRAAELAGRYFGKGLSENEVIVILSCWNQKNSPPISQQELLSVIQSIKELEGRKQIR